MLALFMSVLTGISLLIWVVLLAFRDGFWQTDQRLLDLSERWNSIAPPSVAIVIPARNEADMLPQTLPALLQQTYPGIVQIILVNDNSSDNTAAIAEQWSQTVHGANCHFSLISGKPLPEGWTGKLWAVHQGIEVAQNSQLGPPDYLLLTDADIWHSPDSLTKLVHHAIVQDRDLVSLMVKLRVQSFWERWLIPAFVFFFAKLYPFRAVNHPNRSIGAAAGGCSLIRRQALEKMGGIAAIRGALIDDCTLGQTIKRSGNGRIWLGLTDEILSLRPYDSLATLWSMVSRSAYAQLNDSPILLMGTIVGMILVYGIPIIGLIYGLLTQHGLIALIAGLTYSLMTIAFWPMVRFYDQPWMLSFGLPAIASLYLCMTIDSARQYYQGRGGAWKGRTYS